jgi:hypothetical protein
VRNFLFLVLFLTILLPSCENKEEEKRGSVTRDLVEKFDHPVNPAPAQPSNLSGEFSFTTFEVTDNLGNKKGWGYDIYIDGKKTIHQDVIPAVSGNHVFRTKEDAEKIGKLATEKMKRTGEFPSITTAELDSLRIAR